MVTRSLFVMDGAMPPEACVDFRHPIITGTTSIANRMAVRLPIQNQPQACSAIEQDKTKCQSYHRTSYMKVGNDASKAHQVAAIDFDIPGNCDSKD
jgi:hypothetical protein